MSNFGDLHQVMANPRDTLAKFVPRKAASLDTIRINMYLGKIMEWAITRFTWNNLPDTVDARYIESTLNTAGMLILLGIMTFTVTVSNTKLKAMASTTV